MKNNIFNPSPHDYYTKHSNKVVIILPFSVGRLTLAANEVQKVVLPFFAHVDVLQMHFFIHMAVYKQG